MITGTIRTAALTVALALASQVAQGGIADPDCTAEKAAKSTATKAVVGVGGRCSPAEAAKDTAKDAVGLEDKGPVEKAKEDVSNPLKNDDDKDKKDKDKKDKDAAKEKDKKD
ncbi:MAG: hypothetical protein ABL989_12150 [Gammaproteobacteria bacterium]